MRRTVLLLIIIASLLSARTLTDDMVLNLSDQTWSLWLDKTADWENDSLYLPPVDLGSLPVNPPTCGWDALSGKGKAVSVPATVEEYFWGENGNAFGLAGNYVGVSWFSTTFHASDQLAGKRLVLAFESVRLRAEVFVNRQLVGYDLINGTDFEFNVTDAVQIGQDNELAVRITDPNGNFAWRDWETYKWGNYDIPPSHGFGGITGEVWLRAMDDVFIDDIFIKNKPETTEADIEITMNNTSGNPVKGALDVSLMDGDGQIVQSHQVDIQIRETEAVTTLPVGNPDVKLWSPDMPNLYTLKVDWKGEDESAHTLSERFGFRWFEVRNVDGDQQFYLNSKRVIAISAISWGHWPVNGIYPTPELARKQIQAAKSLGMNMLNFHRGIGQPIVLESADEMGLMYYEEPGGYAPGESDFTKAFKREKLMRMIKRDRNHPSLVIYNMINEAIFPLNWAKQLKPWDYQRQDMIQAHKLDETRCITYTSTCWFGPISRGCPEEPNDVKMCMLPYDTTVYNDIWWDEHHAGGPGVYLDEFYNNPTDIYRGSDNASEIIFYGEDGAVGTPHRLALVREQLNTLDRTGWDGDAYLEQARVYDEFLCRHGFRGAFPTLDDFTQAFGRVAHYYHGRTIENIRIDNTVDGYVINGWEGTKIENHSGIVDCFRNPKADPAILAYYNQPLYVAVKLRNKVAAVGETVIADFFIVNEEDVKGKASLEILVEDDKGTLLKKQKSVKLTGGHTYGELLFEGLNIRPRAKGYTVVAAGLKQGGKIIAEGKDDLFAAALDAGPIGPVAVMDTSGSLQGMLDTMGNIRYNVYEGRRNLDEKCLLVGGTLPPGFVKGNFRMNDPMMDWVSRGNTLIITKNADIWCDYLEDKEILDYRGKRKIDINWFGGNYFVKEHALFKELPNNTVFHWEYQTLIRYEDRNRFGLRIAPGQVIGGVIADHKTEVLTAVSIVPHGAGKILISTLDLEAAIKESSKASIVPKKILENYIKFGVK